MATGTLKILGCGSSAGVPAIGNWWGACNPAEPRNRRTRPSVSVHYGQTMIVVDTGPDFREQMNAHNLVIPDAVIYTHAHADHVNGIDELRVLQRLQQRIFQVYANAETRDQLLRRFDYQFRASQNGFYKQVCEMNLLDMGMPASIGDVRFIPYEQDHGTMKSVGLRFGNLAYSTDVKRLDRTALDILQGTETWIVDAAGYHSNSNPVHMSIEEIIQMNDLIKARNVILTHMPPTMDYQTLIKELPPGYVPAYDGLTLEFEY